MIRDLATVDLFVGAGGLSLGFEDAGFRTLLGSDIDPDAANTFRTNFLGVPFAEGPIQSLTAAEILEMADLARGDVDVLLGGPPC